MRENNAEKYITACGDNDRETVVFTSQSNTITIEIKEREIIDMMGPFLIKYEGECNYEYH